MSISRILELSTRIAANTSKVSDYLTANNLPLPSFDIDGPFESAVPKDATEIEAARSAVIEDAQELRRLMLGPREYLMSYTHNELLPQQAITRFRLAHTFPVGGEATFADIASTSGLKEARIRQVVRFAIMQNIFCEPRPGVVAHSSVSRLLAEDQGMHDWVGASTDDLWQSASQLCNALVKYPGSEEPNETGFALANQTDKSMYEYLSTVPERARRFGSAMRAFTEGPGFELKHVTDNFTWGELKNGIVVDVGGSQGFVCFALARKFPSLSFVVQDLEPVIAAAREDAPTDIADRVKFMAHDFITEQPVRGADVYLLRWILHNWSDKYSTQILRNLVPALKPGAKVVICDNVLPAPGLLSRWHETRLRSMDLCMAEIQNSHERELADWEALFKAAHPNFEFQGGKLPAGSNLSILVAEWRG